MYICTYKLPGREKTFTAPTIPAAHKLFLKDYKEAAGEVKKVKIEKQNDVMFLMVLSYPTYRDFFANPKLHAEAGEKIMSELLDEGGLN
tara:strand:+ start:226 stop:492 length:267 start_codon:yes stop_codon:yes gene_type:complete